MTTQVDRTSTQERPVPAHADRDRLREEWRIAAVEHVRADDTASRMEEGRSIRLAQLIDGIVDHAEQNGEKMSHAAAERIARTSDDWKTYVRKMHDARLHANLLKVEMADKDRKYWESVSSEANERAERRMSR